MAFCNYGYKNWSFKIEDSNSINTSFPNFKDEFNKLGGKIFEKYNNYY